MRSQFHESSPPPAGGAGRRRNRVAGWLAAVVAAGLTACGGGGGGDLAGVGTGGTGSFAVGPITGFGSIVVNGVHYDDSGAKVFDEDGNPSGTSALQLGMMVEVRGTVSNDGVSGTAASFSYAAETRGPVTAVDAAAGTLTVFDRPVKVAPATVFASVAGLAGLAVGNVVEVHGLPDADGAVVATRIEREATNVDGFDGEFRVRGAVSGLTGAAPNQRLTVAGVVVTTDSSTRVDGTLAEGAQVSVRLAKAAAVDGSHAATRVQVTTRSYAEGVSEAELEGLVSGFTAADAPFEVNGYPVQLDASATYENGVAGDLADGVRVEVKGDVVGGVLIVRQVEFKHEDANGGDDGSDAPFEFKGVATCSPAPCAAGAGTFLVRGVTIAYDASTRFQDGLTPVGLDGAAVEVKATAETGASGTTYRATRIEPDH